MLRLETAVIFALVFLCLLLAVDQTTAEARHQKELLDLWNKCNPTLRNSIEEQLNFTGSNITEWWYNGYTIKD